MRLVCIHCAIMTLSSCGPSSNPVGLLTPEKEAHSFPSLLSAYSAAFDAGDLPKAARLAEELYQKNPHYKESAVAYATASMGEMGLSPFSLAKKMMLSAEGEEDPLSSLSALLSLSPEEESLMATLDTTVSDLPVKIPNPMEETRKSVQSLRLLNQAVVALCPWAPESTKNPLDPRHACTPAPIPGKSLVLFIWALAHLGEAMVLQPIINYATFSPPTTNLQWRAARLKTSQGDDFIKQFSSLELVFDEIFPPDGKKITAFSSLVSDLKTVSATFKLLPQLPESLKNFAAIMEKKTTSSQSETSNSFNDLNEIRQSFNENLSTVLGERLVELSGDYSPQEMKEICGVYVRMTGSLQSDAASVCSPFLVM